MANKKTKNEPRKDDFKGEEIVLARIEDRQPVGNHKHNGTDAEQVDLSDLFGLIETVDVVPTNDARNINEQAKIYVNGATLRFYVYDTVNQTWRYSTLT